MVRKDFSDKEFGWRLKGSPEQTIPPAGEEQGIDCSCWMWKTAQSWARVREETPVILKKMEIG
jgi:hypothetical protein